MRVSDGLVELDDLALRRRGARDDFFRLAALGVHGAALDLDAHTVNVAEIVTHDARLRAARDAHGVVDLSTLVRRRRPPARAAPATRATRARRRHRADAGRSPWRASISTSWGVRFDDRAVTPAARADRRSDRAARRPTSRRRPAPSWAWTCASASTRPDGSRSPARSTLPPVAANLRFDLRALEILPFQPYFSDQVNLTVTGGTIGVKGQAAVKIGAARRSRR